MKFSIAKAELQRGLARIQTIVEKRNTMPILANVLSRGTNRKEGRSSTSQRPISRSGIRGSHRPRSRSRAASPSPRRSSSRSCASCPRSRFSSRPAPPNSYLSSAARGRVHARRHDRRRSTRRSRHLAGAHRRGPGRRARRDDRAHDVRRVARRDPLQPERRLLRDRSRSGQAPHGRDRRPSPRLRRSQPSARRSRASSAA